MAYFALWVLGIILCVVAVVFLYKQVTALRRDILFQKQVKKFHPEAVLGSFDRGKIFLDIILTFLVLSMASQANGMGSSEFAPDTLCFIGIAVFCASKAVEHWDKGRMVFYGQGVVWQNEDVPYSTIRKFEASGSQVEMTAKKATWLLSKNQAASLQEKIAQWKKERRSRRS